MGDFEEAMHLPICVVEPAQHWKKVKDLMQRMGQMEAANAVLEGKLQTKNAKVKIFSKTTSGRNSIEVLSKAGLQKLRDPCDPKQLYCCHFIGFLFYGLLIRI